MTESTEMHQTGNIDMAHMSRLSRVEQDLCLQTAQRFTQGLANQVDMVYLHLDVDEFKEQMRSVPAFFWRALLVTNRGRYHADGWSFGAVESLKTVLEKLQGQMDSRLGRLEATGMSA